MRVAINHPYFFPYAGYFRLMASTDILVLLDCVQFPRRGYVHRNLFINHKGELDWFSLNLEKQQRSILIKDIKFTQDIERQLSRSFKKFPVFDSNALSENPWLKTMGTLNEKTLPIEYICESLENINLYFGFNCQLIRSSSLNINKSLSGQNKILDILETLNANSYINAPGGRSLYQVKEFKKREIDLKFLTHYPNNTIHQRSSILNRLLTEDKMAIKSEILTHLNWQN